MYLRITAVTLMFLRDTRHRAIEMRGDLAWNSTYGLKTVAPFVEQWVRPAPVQCGTTLSHLCHSKIYPLLYHLTVKIQQTKSQMWPRRHFKGQVSSHSPVQI